MRQSLCWSLSLHAWEPPAPITALPPPCPWEVTSVTQCHPALQQEKGLACHQHRHIVMGMKTAQLLDPKNDLGMTWERHFSCSLTRFWGPSQPAPPEDSLDLLLQAQGHPTQCHSQGTGPQCPAAPAPSPGDSTTQRPQRPQHSQIHGKQGRSRAGGKAHLAAALHTIKVYI